MKWVIILNKKQYIYKTMHCYRINTIIWQNKIFWPTIVRFYDILLFKPTSNSKDDREHEDFLFGVDSPDWFLSFERYWS